MPTKMLIRTQRQCAFFAIIMEYGSTCICASEKKCGNLTISHVLEHCLAQFLDLWFLKKIRETRWHVVSIVLFQTFCGETAYLVRFIEL